MYTHFLCREVLFYRSIKKILLKNAFRVILLLLICIVLSGGVFVSADEPESLPKIPSSLKQAISKGWRPAQSLPNSALPQKESKVKRVMVKTMRMTPDQMDLAYAMPELTAFAWLPPAANQPGAREEEPIHNNAAPVFKGKNWSHLTLGNAPLTGGPGKPVLPVVPVRLILPNGYGIDSVDIVKGTKVTLKGVFNIEPGQTPAPLLPNAKQKVTPPDPAVYGADKEFPGCLFKVLSVQYKRGVAIAHINLYPVQYRPKTGKISYYTGLRLRVQTKAAPKAIKPKIRFRPDPVKPVSNGVDNPGLLQTGGYSDPGKGAAPGSCDPNDSFQYVIITTEALKNAPSDPGNGVYNFQDLLAQKTDAGVSNTLVTVEHIYANYSGADKQEQIRNFIIDAHNNWETDFILIGGDADGKDFNNADTEPVVVPVRILDCLYVYSHGNIASDLYYQCLDGTWDYNNDGKFGRPGDGPGGGEVDTYAEVYIGRAMVSEAAHVSTFVEKTLRYIAAKNDAYVTNALMVGEHLGFGGVAEYAKNYKEEVRNGGTYNGVACTGFADYFTIDTLYDADGTWPKSDIINKINENKYNIINHLGHCANYHLMKFENPDVPSIVMWIMTV
jgi:hypothetical protein